MQTGQLLLSATAIILVVALLARKKKTRRFYEIPDSDEEMKAAQAMAHDTLPQFLLALHEKDPLNAGIFH
jgi:hypothetical protein